MKKVIQLLEFEKSTLEDMIKYEVADERDLQMIAEINQTLQLLQPDVSGSLLLTIDNVSNMLSYCSKATWIQLQGDDKGWKEWWKKRNELQVNSNDR